MPQKLNPFSIGDAKVLNEMAFNRISRHQEITLLSLDARLRLASVLAEAAGFASAGFPMLKKRQQGLRPVRQILAADVRRAMERANLRVTSSRGYINSRGQTQDSLFFRLVRDTAYLVRVKNRDGGTVPLPIANDPYHLFPASKHVEYNGV